MIVEENGQKTHSSPQVALGMPNDFVIGEVTGFGDFFFGSVPQGMNELCIPGGPFNVKLLRQALHDYAEANQISVYDSQTGMTLRKAVEDAAAAGVCYQVAGMNTTILQAVWYILS